MKNRWRCIESQVNITKQIRPKFRTFRTRWKTWSKEVRLYAVRAVWLTLNPILNNPCICKNNSYKRSSSSFTNSSRTETLNTTQFSLLHLSLNCKIWRKITLSLLLSSQNRPPNSEIWKISRSSPQGKSNRWIYRQLRKNKLFSSKSEDQFI